MARLPENIIINTVFYWKNSTIDDLNIMIADSEPIQLLACYENDKTTFLYRAFVQPVLKRAIMTKYGPPQSG